MRPSINGDLFKLNLDKQFKKKCALLKQKKEKTKTSKALICGWNSFIQWSLGVQVLVLGEL